MANVGDVAAYLLLAAVVSSVISSGRTDVTWFDNAKFSPINSPNLQEYKIESDNVVKEVSAAKKEEVPKPPEKAKPPTKTITDVIDETAKANDVAKKQKANDEEKIPKYVYVGCFNLKRKRKQGDPLPPFLYMIETFKKQIKGKHWGSWDTKTLIDNCSLCAQANESRYFGIENMWECWAGGKDTYANDGIAHEENCEGGIGDGKYVAVYKFGKGSHDEDWFHYCFPESAKIELEDGHRVTMSELKIGDRIKTLDSRSYHGNTDVIGFLHRQEEDQVSYLSIKLLNGQSLRVSGKHMVFKGENSSRRMVTVFADQIRKGDYLVTASGGYNPKGVKLSQVVSITMVTEKGIYAPLTSDGTMLVDGVLVSCYAHWDSHQVAHYVMWPLRAWAEISKVLKAFGNWLGVYESYESMPGAGLQGIHWYADSLMGLVQKFTTLS